MAEILLAGPFGRHNPGADAILEAFLAALPQWDVAVASDDPEETRVRHGCDALPASNRRLVARTAARAEAVVLAGGPVFRAVFSRFWRTRRSEDELLKLSVSSAVGALAAGKPFAAVGVGAGFLGGGGVRLARALVRRADLLVLRNEQSARVLAEAGAPSPFRVGADAAWTRLDEPLEPVATHNRVAVVLNRFAGRLSRDYLIDGLAPLANDGLEIHLVPWQVADDLGVARHIAARLPGDVEILPPAESLSTVRRLLSGYRAVIGLRFHSLVAAASADVPFVAVCHDSEMSDLAARLGQMSVVAGAPPEILTQAAAAAVGTEPAPRAAVQAQIAAAEEGFRLLRLLLCRGRTDEVDEITGLSLAPTPWRP